MIEQINRILNKQLNKYNLANASQSAYVCHIANEVGKKYKFKAKSFKDGILAIQTQNPMEAQEIYFVLRPIITEINEKLKSDKVRKIVFR